MPSATVTEVFAPAWDALAAVRSPWGRTADDLLAERPRIQPLDGFDPVYADIVDYIVRCTHRIWEAKDIGLCRTHYADDVVMHTLAGPARGVETVVQNTVATMAAFSDRVVVAEDVIWSEDAPGLFLSSHRITSHSTQLGDDGPYAATLAPVDATTIADCLVQENRIVEEWLVRDNVSALIAVGLDPWTVARAAAAADLDGDPARHAWRAASIAEVRAGGGVVPPAGHPAAVPAAMLATAFGDDLYGEAALAQSPAVELRWPSGRHGLGRGYWIGCLLQLRTALHDAAFRLDHFAARPLPDGDVAAALRWRLAGRHGGAGVWGAATRRDVLVLAVSHYRLRGGRIVEDVTVFDEVAVLRQVAGGLGA